MRRASLSIGLVILFVIGSYAPLFDPPQAVTGVSSETESMESTELYFPTSTVFSPSLEYWATIDVAEPMVLTRDLRALHCLLYTSPSPRD